MPASGAVWGVTATTRARSLALQSKGTGKETTGTAFGMTAEIHAVTTGVATETTATLSAMSQHLQNLLLR